MSDTECQRCGYDNTGRYHVRALWPPPEPDRDQCPDCRAAPDSDHHPDCTFTVESCSECGAVTDIEPCDEAAQVCESQSCAVETHIPFRMQEWMFESLAPSADLTIAELIESDWNVILEMARDRFRKGYARYGSNMYEWTARERLQNVLEELADAVVYLTSGSIE